MSDQKEFVNGLRASARHERAPQWILFGLSIKPREMLEWLQQKPPDEWINLDVKLAKDDKAMYVEVNSYKKPGSYVPKAAQSQADIDYDTGIAGPRDEIIEYPEDVNVEDIPF